MKTKIQVITHNGMFHADEIAAIAFLKLIFEITSVTRKLQISEEEYNASDIFVLDIGRRYERQLNNYDHHQDCNLMATNVLVFSSFWRHIETKNNQNAINELRLLFNEISDIDTGTKSGGSHGNPGSFNWCISVFNSLDDSDQTKFNKAVAFAESIIDSKLGRMQPNAIIASDVAEKYLKDLLPKHDFSDWLVDNLHDQDDIGIRYLTQAVNAYNKQCEHTKSKFDALERIFDGKVVFTKYTEPMPMWKQLAVERGIKAMVSPNSRGGWQIVSVDSDDFNIPECNTQTFRHNSGFMAVYKNLDTALKHLGSIL